MSDSGAAKIETDEGKAGEKPMSRRSFLDLVIRGGLLTTLAAMVFPALSYLWPVTRRGPSLGRVEVGRVDEIPVWGSKKVVAAGGALFIVRTPKEFKAFSAICTHLGCIISWDEQKKQIDCPCHAGVFDTDGKVLAGPPPRPLPTYPVNVVDGKIFVKL